MDSSHRDIEPSADLSALAWVQEELRRSLDAAHKALRRYVKEAEASHGSDVDAVDPSVLRTARQQLHQGAGALELVNLPEAAVVLRATEAAVQRLIARPQKVTSATVDAIERTSFSLLEYLARLLAGKPVSPVAMFPQYRTVQELAGAERAHPADLWPHAWQWRELPGDPSAVPRRPDGATRGEIESILLDLMRTAQPAAAQRMSNLFAGLGETASEPQTATLWRLAAAFFEAQAHGLLRADVYTKRVASRLLAQLRMIERGEAVASERLAQDLLFFCAQCDSPGDGRSAPRLAAVRQAFGLSHHEPIDYESARLGRFDPAWIAQARKRVAAAKDAWSSVAGGEMHRLAGLNEQFSLVADSVRRLYPSGEMLADELVSAVNHTVQQGAAPAPPLAMEVATSVLYLEASLEDGELDHPQLGARVQRLAERIASVRNGNDPEPLQPWMEELYRRVSDRQTMGSVVQELRASLAEAEKNIDQFFRDPADRNVLIPVPNQLAAMRGVLSVLGMDQASAAVLRMRDEIDALIAGDAAQEAAGSNPMFERLAANLGALGFLIDMLSVQPQLAKSLFVFDAQTGTLSPLMGRQKPDLRPGEAPPAVNVPVPPRLVEQVQSLAVAAIREDIPAEDVARELDRLSHEALVADQPGLAASVAAAQAALERAEDAFGESAAREQLALAMNDFVVTASEPALLEPSAPAPAAAAPSRAETHPAAPGEDDEMREVFLEEAREVLETSREALAALQESPEDVGQLTTVRRAFHTLKGSSRMVGLTDFGEAAWACEQLYNARLAEAPRADEALLEFSAQAFAYLGDWVESIAAGAAPSQDPATVRRSADALRLEGRLVPISAADMASAQAAPPDVMQAPAFELDLSGFESLPAASAVQAAPDEEFPLPAAAFEADAPPTPAQPHEPPPAGEALPAGPDFKLDFGALEALPAAQPAGLAASVEVAQAPHEGDDGADTIPLPLLGDEMAEQPPALPETVELIELDLDMQSAFDTASIAPAEAPASAKPSGSMQEPTASATAPRDDAADAGSEPTPEQTTAVPVLSTGLESRDPQADIEPHVTAEPAWTGLPAPADSSPAGFEPREQAVPGSDTQDGTQEPAHVPAAMADAEAVAAADAAGVHEPAALTEGALGTAREGASPETEPAVAPAELPSEPPAAEPPAPGPVAAWPSGADDDAAQPGLKSAPDDDALATSSDQFKHVGPLRIGISLFNIYLNEADELSRRLSTELAEWAMELQRPVGETAIALAHSLAGSSATVGFTDLSHLARALEHALMRSHAVGYGTPEEGAMFVEVAEEIRRLLHQFAAGFLRSPPPELERRLFRSEVEAIRRLEAQGAAEATGDTEGQPVGIGGEPAIEAPGRMPLAATPASQPTSGAEPGAAAAGASRAGSPAVASPAAPTPAAAPLTGLAQAELKPLGDLPSSGKPVATQRASLADVDDDIDAVDAVDAELFPIFQEEGQELLPQLAARLRDWSRRPGDPSLAAACMRTLHTLKGGARLAGAMRLGELAHRLEASIEHLLARGNAQARDIDPLLERADILVATFEALGQEDAHAPALDGLAAPTQDALDRLEGQPAPAGGDVATAAGLPESGAARHADEGAAAEPLASDVGAAAAPGEAGGRDAAAPTDDIDWSRFVHAPAAAVAAADRPTHAASQSAVRVRGPLLDRMVSQAGEVSITRSRIESEVTQLKGSLADLTENLERLRGQLRDIELQAETQISSRMEAAKAAAEQFDPLEFDRYTRFQELTRMMAESVNDVATVQRTLQRTLEATEDELAAQARLTRDLQDDLLRTRMVEFEGLSERLYRVVRLAAKETGKQVRLDIVGGSIEVDRGVLDRMTGAFEHLLRNCITHGIESPEERAAAGKDPTGTITVALSQEGNEVGVEFRDDGQGLDLARIRERAVAQGLIQPDAELSDAELANLIFTPGFSTAESVTELAGRGIGMDVVKSEVNSMGGRIETATAPGQGTSFKLVLPLTTAVTQVVLLRCAEAVVAVPSTLVETVLRAQPEQVARAFETGTFNVGDQALPFFWLGALLQLGERAAATGRTVPVMVIRSAQQRIVIHVDEVLGNQEVVVKNLGPQLSRMPGLAGMTLLGSGTPTLIYNPVALATLYGEAARAAMHAPQAALPAPAAEAPAAPLVLVVDDSLTVRRVTQRLLLREGMRVALAKDGLEALERLAEERPDVVLSDIEMPRMDGFDLVRNMRGDPRWHDLPVIMITSRIAQKHRDHAAELGVNHYLGKPYSEEDLMALINRYVSVEAAS
jgi:chemosensory pili system protein ChpA (sensor histidine kinase/response regulator)